MNLYAHASRVERRYRLKKIALIIILLALSLYAYETSAQLSSGELSFELWLVLFAAFLAVIPVEMAYVLWARRRREAIEQGEDDPTEISALQNKSTKPLDGDEPNVVYFSGYRPYVGFGKELASWSLVVDSSRPLKGASDAPRSFHIKELCEAVAAQLRDIDSDNTSVKYKMFVDGRRIKGDDGLLPNEFEPPLHRVPDDTLQSKLGQTDFHLRTYLCCTTESWAGQCILSAIYRFSFRKHFCVIEAHTYYLSPFSEIAVRTKDPIANSLSGSVLGIAAFIALSAPLRLIHAPISLMYSLITVRSHSYVSWVTRFRIRRGLGYYDYGNATTFRELVASGDYHQVKFQLLDVIANVKVIHQTFLDTLLQFFESRGIDTAEIRETRQTILNQGVMVFGGQFTAEAVAVGQAAQTKSWRVMPTNKTEGPS